MEIIRNEYVEKRRKRIEYLVVEDGETIAIFRRESEAEKFIEDMQK